MATEKHAPAWRNVLAWSAVGALVYVVAVAAVTALRPDGVAGILSKSDAAMAKMGLVGVLSALAVGLSMRRSTFNGRNIRNLLIYSAVVVAGMLLAMGAVRALLGGASLGASAMTALVLGLTLTGFAVLGILLVAAVHARMALIDAEVADEIRERGRMSVYSWLSVAAMGLALVLLSLSGPVDLLAPGMALAGALVLLAITAGLSVIAWPLMDELLHAISRETGNMAFYLIVAVGGGWAMLAHLGFVAAPAPLDWLTMFTLIMFAASFIAIGRRGLLKR